MVREDDPADHHRPASNSRRPRNPYVRMRGLRATEIESVFADAGQAFARASRVGPSRSGAQLRRLTRDQVRQSAHAIWNDASVSLLP
jgi:hypothetical protein